MRKGKKGWPRELHECTHMHISTNVHTGNAEGHEGRTSVAAIIHVSDVAPLDRRCSPGVAVCVVVCVVVCVAVCVAVSVAVCVAVRVAVRVAVCE